MELDSLTDNPHAFGPPYQCEGSVILLKDRKDNGFYACGKMYGIRWTRDRFYADSRAAEGEVSAQKADHVIVQRTPMIFT